MEFWTIWNILIMPRILPAPTDIRAMRSATERMEQASPQCILDCLELDWEDIRDSPLLVSDLVKVIDFTDLV
ncbi:hypothetical protein TNCV_1965921 [Trichonephila clavipes]|nr:hypothetical protein TNCV_1965921 [Trichonephila clavipes]